MALQNNVAKKTRLSNKGTIVPSRLAHYKTSELLYSEPIPNTGKQYSADILIDVSWSMFPDEKTWNNNRIIGAINSAKELVKLLYNIVDFRIVLFWKWFRTISMNELLSYSDKELSNYEECIRLFHKYWLTYVNWNAINMEGVGFSADTNYTMAIANSLSSFSTVSGWKYIILITDWEENYSFRDAQKVNGIKKVEFWEMKEMLKREEDVILLPIWIDIDISHRFNEAINISNSSETIEHTINFLEKNI